jgi:glycosyltransferase involved in cell wall biosynthesis
LAGQLSAEGRGGTSKKVVWQHQPAQCRGDQGGGSCGAARVVDMTNLSGGSRSNVTTIITTLNEEVHIERSVASAHRLGDVFVVDGLSTDATREIARGAGASVVEHAWNGYSTQKNWALGSLGIDSEWVLFLDADEFVTNGLRDEIEGATTSRRFDGYYIPRQNIFLGRLLRHAWWYPDYQLRLFRLSKGRYEDRLVHEHVVLDGVAGFLKQPIMHENLKGIDAFVERHMRYAGYEAAEMLRARSRDFGDQRRGRFFGSWPERRRALKLHVWYRLPGRPAIRFLWMYLVKRGFLDGKQGRVYCQLLAVEEALINAKLLELELKHGQAKGTQGAEGLSS